MKVKRTKVRCSEKLVRELVSQNSMLATTINVTGVTRLALDWLDMKEEIAFLRKRLEETKRTNQGSP